MAALKAETGIVDVVIAAWNRADTIERAVSSAVTEPEVRNVIVVDDGSSDDTAARARRLGVDRVVVLRLPTNNGPAAARNRALEISTAPWIAILDGDDFILPGRFEKLLSYAGDWDFVADDILRMDRADGASDDARPVMFDRPFEPWPLEFSKFVLGNCGRRGRSRNELGFFKPLMRRSFLDRMSLRYDERLRLGEDYAFYARGLALGARFFVTPACGYVSVMRVDSLSARHTRQDLERLRDADVELAALNALSDRDRRAITKHYRGMDARVQWLRMIEAFKSRSPRGFLAPFIRSPEVSTFLVRKLFEEACSRSEQWLSHQWR
jgi:succinoglycan biosynthesis protein ExoU